MSLLRRPHCGSASRRPTVDARTDACVGAVAGFGLLAWHRGWSVGGAGAPWHSLEVRWNDNKGRRFQALRAAEARGPLTDAEYAELSRLLEDLDADEADALRPAMEQMA